MITDKNSLKPNEEDFIKEIFKKILENGETYNVEEIESWFKNEGSWKNKKTIIRISNMSHYILEKHNQSSKFRIVSNDHTCD